MIDRGVLLDVYFFLIPKASAIVVSVHIDKYEKPNSSTCRHAQHIDIH